MAVENKAGASGNIGTQQVVRAQPDGYTLLLQNSTMVTNLAVTGKLPYDPDKDLTPIMLLGITPIALAAHPGANVSSVRELVAAAKAKPAAFSYGSCGIGTPQHFVMELLRQETGIAAAHAGYKGCAPAMTDVVGGQIQLAIVSANLVAPYAKSGQLKVLGVSTAQRYALLPNTPTFEEQGLKPFDFAIWYALMGPARMPPEVVAKITADVTRVLADARVQENLSTAGVVPFHGTAQDWRGWSGRMRRATCSSPGARTSRRNEPTKNRPGGRFRVHGAGSGLAAVLVRVAGDHALGGVAHAFPRVARGGPGIAPFQRRLAAGTAPVAAQFGFHFVERAARIAVERLDAMPVGGLVVLEVDVLAGVRAARVVVAPVAVLDHRVGLLAHHGAGHGAHRGADRRTHRSGHAAGQCAGRRAAGHAPERCAAHCAHAGLLRVVVSVHADFLVLAGKT
ncbi:hypothetical protein HK414_10495 [Ramlibacter terrae]|uniref:Tripartite tricarboxylate transporter substrate binding protein n=1 Tax=Ramlibacter terrae TaxID=2732511 RepID=A0ABX6P357_9BURK|nr:hypothetical protein HK414_10495 [Ramlibacter terrae]